MRAPRRTDSLTLTAVHAAIGCARMFVSQTLYHWKARVIENDALLVVTELVTAAVQATGVMDEHPPWWKLDYLNLIKVCLLDMETSIVIEVWDSHSEPNESIIGRWNYYRLRSGDKVVWWELEPPQRIAVRELRSPLPRRIHHPLPVPASPIAAERDPDLLRRILEGLRKPGDEAPGGEYIEY